MSAGGKLYRGGCLCGAVRYEAQGEPRYAGHCYCADCRKASGSGFVPFMVFSADAVQFSGQPRQFVWKVAGGKQAVRNFCPDCGGLVFGGIIGVDTSFTLYAGSLDDPSLFHPRIAIFTRGRPEWALIPAELTLFEDAPH
jgi:hypothetical protein